MQEVTNSKSTSQKLSAEIKKTWGKLSDEEIGFQSTKPDKFYEAVKTKYSINKDEAEKTVKKLEAECSETGGAQADKDSQAQSAPEPKAANA